MFLTNPSLQQLLRCPVFPGLFFSLSFSAFQFTKVPSDRQGDLEGGLRVQTSPKCGFSAWVCHEQGSGVSTWGRQRRALCVVRRMLLQPWWEGQREQLLLPGHWGVAEELLPRDLHREVAQGGV